MDTHQIKKKLISSEAEFKIDEEKRLNKIKRSQEFLEHKGKLLCQRDRQRTILFNYCLWSISILMILMFVILGFQIYYKINTGKDLISSSTYNIIFVSIIIQFIGVVYIIAKNLWDEKVIDSIYKNSIFS
jgi:hypothetical protein